MLEVEAAQIRYVHGNRLERLAERLAVDLASGPLEDPLAPELIVVPHPGMGRWLQRELARHWGIAMRLDLPLPGRLIWRIATGLTGIEESDRHYEVGPLAFRIQQQLDAWARVGWRGAPRGMPQPRDALARWSLAERLAGLYDQYLVYRPDWIRAWDSGSDARGVPAQGAWQGQLWRVLRQGARTPHRAEVLDRAMRALDKPAPATRVPLPSRLSIFGVSTLPEPYLLFFAQLARHTGVGWYHPDPSAAYWGDIVSGRERASAVLRLRRLGRRAPDAHLDTSHPLLASLGGIGRDFVRSLHGQGIAVIADEDAFEVPATETLLGWLQAGIVLLDPAHAPPPVLGTPPDVQVHSCPTRLREVEVLHDVLLGLFQEMDGLRPHEIVVMSPRPTEYAPLVRAVFDAAPAARHVPYTIADRSLAAMHPLPALLLELLDLPDERFAATRVLGWLATPTIARRFGVDEDGQEWLRVLVADAGIRWGLDGEARAAAGSTDSPLYTWRFGLERLLLGYACGPAAELVEGRSPHAGVEGAAALAVGALASFVEGLAEWSERLRAPRPAAAWAATLTELAGAFMDRVGADEAEAAGHAAIAAVLEAWEADALAGDSAALPIEPGVMRAALAARLEQVPTLQSFPGQGVTVCAMVPMRNLPFRVVCLLGLDGGEFPRVAKATGLDLMIQSPRPGDRSLTADDRYLFLEALMSAREHLHLSYVGREGRDLAKRPPGAVLSELLDFIAAAYPRDERASILSALVFEHRLHPFAPEYFVPGAAFHSHAGEWMASAAQPPPSPPLPTRAIEPRPDFNLSEVARYARDPQRYFAERVLRLAVPRDDGIEDEEPLALDALDGFRLRERALRLRERGVALDAAQLLPRVTAEALLPIGVAGRPGWSDALAIVDSMRTTRAGLLDSGHVLPDLDVDARVGDCRLGGRISGRTTCGLVHARAGRMRGGDWARLALEAWLEREATGSNLPAWGIDVADKKVRLSRLDLDALDPGWVHAWLRSLHAAQHAQPPWLRRASWAYATTFGEGRDAALRAADLAFRGSAHTPGDSYDPATRLLWGEQPSLAETFEQAARELLVPLAKVIEELA